MLYLTILSALAWEAKIGSGGDPYLWPKTQIDYYLNTAGYIKLTEMEIENAINEAANAWDPHQHGAGISFKYSGMTKIDSADYADGEHTITFDDSWTLEPELLAVTHVWTNGNNEIVHFDIEINVEHHEWSVDGSQGTHDLTNSMTHEFGHALGLEHSDDLEATMAESTTQGETKKRDINQDDSQGFATLYPNGYDPSQPSTGNNDAENDDNTGSNNGNGASGGGGGPSGQPNATPNNSGGGGGGTPVALESGCSVVPGSSFLLVCLALIGIKRRAS